MEREENLSPRKLCLIIAKVVSSSSKKKKEVGASLNMKIMSFLRGETERYTQQMVRMPKGDNKATYKVTRKPRQSTHSFTSFCSKVIKNHLSAPHNPHE